MSDRCYADEPWESLLRTFVYADASEARQAAWDEMRTRVGGGKEAVYEIIVERARVDVPIGTMADWVPERFLKGRT